MFPLARYRFEFKVTRPIRLPDYAGSMLRGAFGHALRQLACMTKQRECTNCPLTRTCPYPAIFAPLPPVTHSLQKFSQIPVPYVIEPPPWGACVIETGERFIFHMVLIGHALKELPLIILAWRRALARGIGAGDGTAELMGVAYCPVDGPITPIYRAETGLIAPHPQQITRHAAPCPNAVTLTFNTPLRLQQNGHALAAEKLNARILLMALIRRASLLAEFHAGGPLLADFEPLRVASSAIREQKQLVWRDWTRFSSRQQQKMSLGGVLGTWTLVGDLTPFSRFLYLGQWLHVGKEAAFGLGGFCLADAQNIDSGAAADKTREQQRQVTERMEVITTQQ